MSEWILCYGDANPIDHGAMFYKYDDDFESYDLLEIVGSSNWNESEIAGKFQIEVCLGGIDVSTLVDISMAILSCTETESLKRFITNKCNDEEWIKDHPYGVDPLMQGISTVHQFDETRLHEFSDEDTVEDAREVLRKEYGLDLDYYERNRKGYLSLTSPIYDNDKISIYSLDYLDWKEWSNRNVFVKFIKQVEEEIFDFVYAGSQSLSKWTLKELLDGLNLPMEDCILFINDYYCFRYDYKTKKFFQLIKKK